MIAADFTPDFLFLRSTGPGGESYGGFRWPTEAGAMVNAPDWNPDPFCGGGLHGLAYGLGDLGLMRSPGDPGVLWYVCEAMLSESVNLGDEIKVPRCRVVYAGTFGDAMELITPAQSAEVIRRSSGSASATGDSGSASATGYSGSASATGYRGSASATGSSGSASATGDRGSASATGYSGSASATGYRGSASATGERGSASATGERGSASATGSRGSASATGEHSIAVGGGFESRAMAGEGCLLVLVEREAETGAIIHHFAGMVGQTQEAKPGVWYTLRDGKLTETEQ